jgi:hypothetical protein
MENDDTSLVVAPPENVYPAGFEREHRENKRGRPRTSYVEDKVMEFLDCIAEGMPTRGAAAIAQIPFETLRNWMSKNDPAFRPDFFRAFEKARAIAVQKNIKKLNDSKDWRAAAFWLERNTEEFAPKEKAPSITNQVAVSSDKPPGIILDEETIKQLSDAYDAMRKEKSSSDNNTDRE